MMPDFGVRGKVDYARSIAIRERDAGQYKELIHGLALSMKRPMSTSVSKHVN